MGLVNDSNDDFRTVFIKTSQTACLESQQVTANGSGGATLSDNATREQLFRAWQNQVPATPTSRFTHYAIDPRFQIQFAYLSNVKAFEPPGIMVIVLGEWYDH